ncbi:helix-turn-helix domain-containing protein [Lichenihabitans sp. Uapishka_5]|uniref:helix-turn-helix domain-containing protein n=1 Tax=Lichenihabitans sp. Uapishka_5 TaxID=3037302 RepID=UPI0029E811CF|nr:helix-turn-helix domain-containing protein [Lichenihabitans sp. Uapishka_5]MDX7952664.1 helix-turn-helix domain-containing protein [Lichenihabitans sp. Uapishka_5]
MTMPAKAEPLGRRLPSADERAAANHLRKILAAHTSDQSTKLHVFDEEKNKAEITLAPGLSTMLMELLRHIGKGDAVTLVPVSQMLTTQQAADILNVSRPYLVSLIDADKIKHTKVGRHRRIRAEDLLAYKEKRDIKRRTALADLAEGDAALL